MDIISFCTALSVCGVFIFLVYAFFYSVVNFSVSGMHLKSYDKLSFLLIPIGLFVSGALSSGGHHYGLYFQFALLVVLVFYVLGFNNLSQRVVFSSGFLLLAIASYGFVFKAINPYSWHSYKVPKLFYNRDLIYTKTQGYVFIDKNLLGFITPVCNITNQKDDLTLLSIPLSFANYYCGKEPWHDYVQTFFDLTSKDKVELLLNELVANPPDFILYQRQLENLRRHEIVYNNGKPLPQRLLDQYIMEMIDRKRWSVVYSSTYGDGNTWYLLKTRDSSL